MKIVLINDEGQSIASFESPLRPEDRSPAQAFALLDLLEKLLESARRDRGEVEAGESRAAAVLPSPG